MVRCIAGIQSPLTLTATPRCPPLPSSLLSR
jgi:hypothetical protein